MRWWLIVLFLCVAPGVSDVEATVHNAATCSHADVSAKVTLAANGDTVIIPAGSCTWATGLGSNCTSFATQDVSFCLSHTDGDTKYITIQGAGIGQTIITDGIPKNQSVAGPIYWRVNGAGLSRVTGIEIRGTIGTTGDGVCQGIGANPMLQIYGSSSQVRIDHNKFVTHGGCPALYLGSLNPSYVRGVADHNTFDISGNVSDPSPAGDCFFLVHQSWGDVGDQGDNSWAQPDTVGTAEAFFFEDNIFHNDQTVNWYRTCTEGWNGMRIVVRHNNFRATTYAHHGTGSGVRSARQYEVYENDWTGPDGVSAWNLQGNAPQPTIGSRGGVGVVFNNRVLMTNGSVPINSHDVVVERQPGAPNDSGRYGACSGTNSWDQNNDVTSGRRCLDQPGSGYGQLLNSALNGSGQVDATHPINTVTGTKAWPNQVAQPTYGWNNTVNGVVRGAKLNTSNGDATPNPITLGTDVIDEVQRPGYVAYTYPHPLQGIVTSSNLSGSLSFSGGVVMQ